MRSPVGEARSTHQIFPLLKKFKDYDDGEIMDMYGDVVESYRIIYESFTRLPLLFIAV